MTKPDNKQANGRDALVDTVITLVNDCEITYDADDTCYDTSVEIITLCQANMVDKNGLLDEVLAIVLKEPDYISNSQSTRQGYVRAVNDMQRAIEGMRDDN